MADRSAIIAEVNRQSQMFYDAISTAAHAKGTEIGGASIEALANAIGTFAGATLAAVPAGPERDLLGDYIIQQMFASLKKHDGSIRHCHVVNLEQLQ